MYLDSQLQFSDGQAVTSAAASTNLIDLGAARDIGSGRDLYVVVNCTTAMTDTGSDSTLQVDIQTDDNSSFSSATTAQTVGTFAATSAAGTQLIAKIDVAKVQERYVRLYFTPAGGDLSGGAFDAFVAYDIEKHKVYADNITIS